MDSLVKINIRTVSDEFLADSREVANNFGKRHDHVLRDIDNLKDAPNFGEMFYEMQVPDSYGRLQRAFNMNRDGFSLLAMGFTGRDALEWKVKYISAFNAMEKAWNTPEQIFARALKMADAKIQNLQSEVNVKNQIIGELKPKADYVDRILQNKGLVTITQIAKDYGMSGRGMNERLHDLGIQYKQSDQWLLYAPYQKCGYTHSDTIDITRSDGRSDVKMNTKWTQKGRLFLYEKLKTAGIYPVIERN